MKKLALVFAFALPLSMFAQDNLVLSLDKNKSEKSKEKYKFTTVIEVTNTPVKNQASSGTCWAYSTNSFLESEMSRAGRQPIELSPIFTARKTYNDKAENYIKMHGSIALGEGGECHDAINVLGKYGAIPFEKYKGLNYGFSKNKFAEMSSVLQAMLEVYVKNPNGKLSPNWKQAYNAVMDSYLGTVPDVFEWNGKQYTPQSFAKEVVGLNADDYIELLSTTQKPYYKPTMMMMPDNWALQTAINIPMQDITTIIDNALQNGYTVAWATDVSEKYFSWKNGVAFVPEKDWDDMSEDEQKALFDGPKKEKTITSEMREEGLENYTTTDDHGMHIVGLVKDQNGREYYKVKNSWGEKNDYKGYLYVTKNFVLYKTTAILLNKNAVPAAISNKINS